MLGIRPRQHPDQEALRDTIGQVTDPELGVGLAELGMLGDVGVDRDGGIDVVVRLTTDVCPMRDELAAAVARAVPDRVVRVRFAVMGQADREETARRFAAAGRPRGVRGVRAVYAVASGKGGVGKSSVAANLAAALAAQGKSVGLLDADVWGYSVPQLFGVHRRPIALAGTMLPVIAHGVRLMSLGFLVADEAPVVWRGPMLHKALVQFTHDVQWGELDALVLDLPPGTGDVTLSVLELFPDASLLVVTTPQTAATTVAARVGAMARDAGLPVAGVVENMSEVVCGHCGDRTPLFGTGGGRILAAALDAPLLGEVPLDLALRQAGDDGRPVVLAAPGTPSARALSGVAATLRPVRRSLVGRQLGIEPVQRA